MNCASDELFRCTVGIRSRRAAGAAQSATGVSTARTRRWSSRSCAATSSFTSTRSRSPANIQPAIIHGTLCFFHVNLIIYLLKNYNSVKHYKQCVLVFDILYLMLLCSRTRSNLQKHSRTHEKGKASAPTPTAASHSSASSNVTSDAVSLASLLPAAAAHTPAVAPVAVSAPLPRVFRCERCTCVFRRAKSLATHQLRLHSNLSRALTCASCAAFSSLRVRRASGNGALLLTPDKVAGFGLCSNSPFGSISNYCSLLEICCYKLFFLCIYTVLN